MSVERRKLHRHVGTWIVGHSHILLGTLDIAWKQRLNFFALCIGPSWNDHIKADRVCWQHMHGCINADVCFQVTNTRSHVVISLCVLHLDVVDASLNHHNNELGKFCSCKSRHRATTVHSWSIFSQHVRLPNLRFAQCNDTFD